MLQYVFRSIELLHPRINVNFNRILLITEFHALLQNIPRIASNIDQIPKHWHKRAIEV